MGEERREEKREDLGNYRLVSQWYTHKEISEKKKKKSYSKTQAQDMQHSFTVIDVMKQIFPHVS